MIKCVCVQLVSFLTPLKCYNFNLWNACKKLHVKEQLCANASHVYSLNYKKSMNHHWLYLVTLFWKSTGNVYDHTAICPIEMSGSFNVIVAIPVTMKDHLILLAALVSSILMCIKMVQISVVLWWFQKVDELVKVSMSRTQSVDSVKALSRF